MKLLLLLAASVTAFSQGITNVTSNIELTPKWKAGLILATSNYNASLPTNAAPVTPMQYYRMRSTNILDSWGDHAERMRAEALQAKFNTATEQKKQAAESAIE